MDQGWHRSQWLFVLFAAVYWLGGMHFFMQNAGGSGFSLQFNMVGWLFASLMIGVGLWHITLTTQLVFSRPQLWLWLGLALMLIPLFTHGDVPVDIGVPRFIGLAGGLLLLFALSQLQLSRQQRFSFLYLLLGAVLVEALFALVQYYLLGYGNWIGYNYVINRPYGIFQKDSVLSSFMALGATIALFLLLVDVASRRGVRLALNCAVVFFSGLLLVVIQSRSGQIGLLLSGTILFLLLFKHQQKYAWLTISLLVCGLASGVVSYLWLSHGRGLDSYIATIDFRLVYWRHCLDLFFEHPLFGVGYGMFERSFVDSYYAIPATISGKSLIEANLDHPHNEILYWMVEGGIVALFGLLIMLAGWGYMLFRAPRPERLALFALPLPLFFHAMVEYPFYHSTAHWLALIWLLWFTDAESEQQTVMPLQNWLLLRAMAILIPLITVPFMLTGLHTSWLITQYERGGMKEPALLNKVINPVPWYSRFMYDVISARLMMALESGNQSELQAYVDWAKEFVNLTPRANVYFNAALALDAMGQHDEAIRWRAEGQRLFPADPIFKPKPASAAVSVSGAAMSASSPQAASSAH